MATGSFDAAPCPRAPASEEGLCYTDCASEQVPQMHALSVGWSYLSDGPDVVSFFSKNGVGQIVSRSSAIDHCVLPRLRVLTTD
jgi:hypothetical protein